MERKNKKTFLDNLGEALGELSEAIFDCRYCCGVDEFNNENNYDLKIFSIPEETGVNGEKKLIKIAGIAGKDTNGKIINNKTTKEVDEISEIIEEMEDILSADQEFLSADQELKLSQKLVVDNKVKKTQKKTQKEIRKEETEKLKISFAKALEKNKNKFKYIKEQSLRSESCPDFSSPIDVNSQTDFLRTFSWNVLDNMKYYDKYFTKILGFDDLEPDDKKINPNGVPLSISFC